MPDAIKIEKPCGLAVFGKRLYIADTGQHRICVRDEGGELRVLAGSSGEAGAKVRREIRSECHTSSSLTRGALSSARACCLTAALGWGGSA